MITDDEVVRDNVVGKTITGMEWEHGKLVLTLEGEACATMDLSVEVDSDHTLVLIVHDDAPTKSGEVSSSFIEGQMTLSDVVDESPTISTGVSSSFECAECGCPQSQHIGNYNFELREWEYEECLSCKTCARYVGE